MEKETFADALNKANVVTDDVEGQNVGDWCVLPSVNVDNDWSDRWSIVLSGLRKVDDKTAWAAFDGQRWEAA
jgi:hypothetical protein|tara:strand:- start:172 stop:387 length:216 start_codon:yes stop_codon:yes gene_type:complete